MSSSRTPVTLVRVESGDVHGVDALVWILVGCDMISMSLKWKGLEKYTVGSLPAHEIHQAIIDLVVEDRLFPLVTLRFLCLGDLVSISVFASSVFSCFHPVTHLFITTVSSFSCEKMM